MKKGGNHKALFVVMAHAGIAVFTAAVALAIGCPFRRFFGIPCPSCGMSRAYFSLLRGDIREAFAFHPLFWLAIPLLFLFLHREVFNIRISQKKMNILAIVFIVLLIVVYLGRVFILHDPVLRIDFESSVLFKILASAGIAR